MDGAILQVAHIAVLYSSIFADSDASSSLSQSVLKTVASTVHTEVGRRQFVDVYR